MKDLKKKNMEIKNKDMIHTMKKFLLLAVAAVVPGLVLSAGDRTAGPAAAEDQVGNPEYAFISDISPYSV